MNATIGEAINITLFQWLGINATLMLLIAYLHITVRITQIDEDINITVTDDICCMTKEQIEKIY